MNDIVSDHESNAKPPDAKPPDNAKPPDIETNNAKIHIAETNIAKTSETVLGPSNVLFQADHDIETEESDDSGDINITDLEQTEHHKKGTAELTKQRTEIISKYSSKQLKHSSKSESDSKQNDKFDPLCVCKVYMAGALSIECDICHNHWHLKCASLEGLTVKMVSSIVEWRCYNCFVSPVPTSPSAFIKATIESELRSLQPIVQKTFDIESSIYKDMFISK